MMKNGIIWLAILAALAMGFLLWQQRQQAQIQALQYEQALITCQQAHSAAEDALRAQLTLVRDSDTKVFELTDGSNKLVTACFYNPVRRAVALDLGGVPAPPAGRYLQLWAIINEQPVSMGMVPAQAVGSWHPLLFLPDITGFELSQETNPNGNDRPTMVILHS